MATPGPIALVGGDEFHPGNEPIDRFLANERAGGPAFVLATRMTCFPVPGSSTDVGTMKRILIFTSAFSGVQVPPALVVFSSPISGPPGPPELKSPAPAKRAKNMPRKY